MEFLDQMGQWCAGLKPEDVPPDVLRRAQIQHLSTAGAIRSVAKWDAQLPGEKAAKWAGLSALIDNTDHIVWSQTSAGGVCTTWVDTKGQKALAMLTSTVAANEIGARLGLALGPKGEPWWIHSLTAAVVRSRRLGLSGEQCSNAMAIALANCPTPGSKDLGHIQTGTIVAKCIQTGTEAAESANQGVQGPRDWLGTKDSPFDSACIPNGRRAFNGLGECWLGRTTSYSLSPGNLFSKVAVQGVQEILRRHIKAADRRLRVDQVDRIVVRTNALALDLNGKDIDPAAICRSIPSQIGLALATNDLSAPQFHPDVLAEHHDAIRTIAQKVVLSHDWVSTIGLMQEMRSSLSPVYGETSPRKLLSQFASGSGVPDRSQWADLIKSRPDRIFRKSTASTNMADMDTLSFRYPFAIEAKLYTTRGGWWPERRGTPSGAPGWSWQAILDGVAKKWACGQEGAADKAGEQLDSLPTGAASKWVRGLGL
jgi:hypothetical protein